MGYTEEYRKHMGKYETLLKQYSKVVDTEQYKDIYQNMPFEFLNAKQKAETLELYTDMGSDSKFKFKRADDAISFYYTAIDTRKNIDELLESASYIVQAAEIAEKANELVDNSPYLPETLKLYINVRLTEMAKECLTMLPKYPNMLTKNFRYTFIESCLECLNKESVQKMVEKGVIKVNDVPFLKATGNENYTTNLNYLYESMSLSKKIIEVRKDIKVKGTSFENPDGSLRQEILKDMMQSNSQGIVLKAGTFTPPGGETVNSVGVYWKEKQIGFLPQEEVNSIYEKFENPEFEGVVKSINGGGDYKYGIHIDVTILSENIKTPEKVME